MDVNLEEAENCILANALNNKLNSLYVEFQENYTKGYNISLSEEYEIGKDNSNIYRNKDIFAHNKEYEEICNEVQVSYAALIIAIIAFVIFVCAAIIGMFLSSGYKKKYEHFRSSHSEKKSLTRKTEKRETQELQLEKPISDKDSEKSKKLPKKDSYEDEDSL